LEITFSNIATQRCKQSKLDKEHIKREVRIACWFIRAKTFTIVSNGILFVCSQNTDRILVCSVVLPRRKRIVAVS
jgi:hypothetical protein